MARGRSESRDGTEMVVAVDVGSAMVRVVGAEIGADGGAEIFSFGQAKAMGIRRGIVEDVDEASYAIRAALESAGLEAVVRGALVVAGISGVHVRSFNAVGEAAVNRGDSVITERDVVKARAAAQTQAAACDDVVLHSAPGGIRVDGYLCRRSPVGMRGALVQAETRVVTAGEEAVERLRRAARMAGVEIDEVLSSVVAAGRAAVQRTEAEAGVVHMDIGAGTTDAAAYFNNALLHTGSAPVGGDHLSNDIAMALNTSFSVGEGVLHDHGAASLEGAALKEEVTIPCYGVSGYRRFRRSYLLEVIRLRVTELLQLGWAAAVGARRRKRPAGLVLTGGVAALPSIADLAHEVLGVPARVGEAAGGGVLYREGGAVSDLRGPAHASLLGLLRLYRDPVFGPLCRRQADRPRGFRLFGQLEGLRA